MLKFYVCETCGNQIQMVKDSKVPPFCCGKKMVELVAGSVDASQEKHVPVVKVEGKKVFVEVGSVAHPMIDVHYIEWIALESKDGYQLKYLNPNDEPKVVFDLSDNDEYVNVYAYCNLHGLWKAE